MYVQYVCMFAYIIYIVFSELSQITPVWTPDLKK